MRNMLNQSTDRRSVLRLAGASAAAGFVSWHDNTLAQKTSPLRTRPTAQRPDWPVGHGNPARTGHAVEANLTGGPELLWRFRAGTGSGQQSPLIVEDVVYFSAGILGTSALIALDLADGEYLWHVPLDFQPFGSTPAIADGVAWVAGIQGDIATIDLDKQDVIWQTQLDTGTSSSPVVDDTFVFIGADDDVLYALDRRDGSEQWRFAVGDGASYTMGPSPALSDGVVWFASSSESGKGELFAIDAGSGEEIWHFRPDAPGLHTPAVRDDVVYAGSDDGYVYAVDAASGDLIWQSEVGSINAAVAVTDDAVLAQTFNGMLAKLDRASGELQWHASTSGSWCAPVVAGDLVLVGSHDMGKTGLHAIDFATGESRWSVLTGSMYAPVAISGNMILVTDDASVCAIRLSEADDLERGTDGERSYLTSIAFSYEITEDNEPIDPGNVLPYGGEELCATFDHAGILYETPMDVRWLLDGEEVVTRSEPWPGGQTRALEVIRNSEGPLPVGTYEIEIRIKDVLTRTGLVTIE